MKRIEDVDLIDKCILIREDLNVPMDGARITDLTRITRAIPTIQYARESADAVIVMSHRGRPTEGEHRAEFSLAPVAAALAEACQCEVKLATLDDVPYVSAMEGLVLLENVRENVGEKANSDALAKQYASLCDVFVMDAFATAHREEASTAGVARFAPLVCAGPLLAQELEAIGKVIDQPERPVLAIVGGAKVSTKIILLENLLNKVDYLIVGGGIANTFLAAQGVPMGKSLYESNWVERAKDLLLKAEQLGVVFPLPCDVVVGDRFDADAAAQCKPLDHVAADDMIMDVGPETLAAYAPCVAAAKTVLWNGPLGVFEFPAFAAGTKMLGEAIGKSDAFSIAGGGDTVAALSQFGLSQAISYISTGGGAFLELLEGNVLPGVAALEV